MYSDEAVTYPPEFTFDVGDRVRIALNKSVFAKSFTPNWSLEVFTIVTRQSTYPAVYELEAQDGEKVLGTFYREELQRVS